MSETIFVAQADIKKNVLTSGCSLNLECVSISSEEMNFSCTQCFSTNELIRKSCNCKNNSASSVPLLNDCSTENVETVNLCCNEDKINLSKAGSGISISSGITYYLEQFIIIIKNVVADDMYSHLFNENDRLIIASFLQLSGEFIVLLSNLYEMRAVSK